MASLKDYQALLDAEIEKRNKLTNSALLEGLVNYYMKNYSQPILGVEAASGKTIRLPQEMDKYGKAGEQIIRGMYGRGINNIDPYLTLAKELQTKQAEEQISSEIENQVKPSLLESLLKNLMGG